MIDHKEAILGLKMIALRAEKLALDLEKGRLWPGEYQDAVTEISRTLRGLPEERGR